MGNLYIMDINHEIKTAFICISIKLQIFFHRLNCCFVHPEFSIPYTARAKCTPAAGCRLEAVCFLLAPHSPPPLQPGTSPSGAQYPVHSTQWTQCLSSQRANQPVCRFPPRSWIPINGTFQTSKPSLTSIQKVHYSPPNKVSRSVFGIKIKPSYESGVGSSIFLECDFLAGIYSRPR